MPLPIIADAAIAADAIGDGKLIPLVIVDTSNRPDLEELVRVHDFLPPGDVECRWGMAHAPVGEVWLILSFKRPIEAVAILEFEIVRQGILVDQILTSRVLYLQPGRTGDRFVKNPLSPMILVEVPDTGFGEYWDRLFFKHLTKHFRAQDLGRQQAKRAARQAIKELRDFGRLRV